jgi:predicted RNA-binding protein
MAIRKQEHDDEHAENETDITLEISPEIRRRIKRAAAQNNLSVEEYLERVIEQVEKDDIALQEQKKPLTQEKLAGIFRAMEEIQQHTQGQVFDDPVEVIRQMREERLRELGFNE